MELERLSLSNTGPEDFRWVTVVVLFGLKHKNQ